MREDKREVFEAARGRENEINNLSEHRHGREGKKRL